MTSEDLYNKVIAGRNVKEIRTMNNLKSICDSLEERNLDINVQRIGREAVRMGTSPRCNTIYNSEMWSEYVKLRAAEQVIEVEKSEEVDVMERIIALEKENSVLRAFIRKMNVK